MYQDSAGTTPVTAVGQQVGLHLDKRLGLAQGSNIVTNGTFDADLTGWTTGTDAAQVIATWDAGRAKLTRGAGGTGGALTQTFATVSGTWYKLTFTATAGAGGSGVAVRVDSGILGAQVVGAGTKSVFFLATGATAAPAFWNINSNAIDFVDDVTCTTVAGNHRTQATAASRPTLRQDASGFYNGELDGVDDSWTSTTGGGGTAGFFYCASIKPSGGAGAARTLFSDAGTNTGYQVRINASNQLELAAGNGTAFTTVATAGTLSVGTTYVISAWDDGTNLNVQIDNGTVAQTARPAVSAGTAGFTVGKDNGAASSFYTGALYQDIYRQGVAPSLTQIAQVKRFVASRGGVSL